MSLQQLFGKRLKITIKDSRIFTGIFHCVDRNCNFIIYETVEISIRDEDEDEEFSTFTQSEGEGGGGVEGDDLEQRQRQRHLGEFAMIPGSEILKIEAWNYDFAKEILTA